MLTFFNLVSLLKESSIDVASGRSKSNSSSVKAHAGSDVQVSNTADCATPCAVFIISSVSHPLGLMTLSVFVSGCN